MATYKHPAIKPALIKHIVADMGGTNAAAKRLDVSPGTLRRWLGGTEPIWQNQLRLGNMILRYAPPATFSALLSAIEQDYQQFWSAYTDALTDGLPERELEPLAQDFRRVKWARNHAQSIAHKRKGDTSAAPEEGT